MRLLYLLRTGLIAALIAVFAILPAGAHSPSDLQLSYDPAKGELLARFTHPVANPSSHYLREVEVEVVGFSPERYLYSSQPSVDTFSYVFPLQLSAGGRVRVKGTCSIGGEIQRELMVPAATGVSPPPAMTFGTPTVTGTTLPAGSPGFGAPATALAGVSAAMLVLVRRRG